MRVIRLEAEGFKRLKAIAISPTSNLVEITGENGEGKSSCLDAIWAAVGGKDAAPEKAIHTGAETARVSVALGEGGEVKLNVTRRFRMVDGVQKTDLIVESGEGARFSSPQGMLDALVGELCFDPLAFTRMKDEEQIKSLRSFVPEVDFAKTEGLNKVDYDKRTEVNRQIKQVRAGALAIREEAGTLPAEVDIDALEGQLAEAAEHNTLVERRKNARTQAEARIEGLTRDIDSLLERVDTMRAERADLRKKLDEAEALPAPIDVADVREKLEQGRRANALRDRIRQKNQLAAQVDRLEKDAEALTSAIEERTAAAAKAVQSAKMPVKGLGFGDGFVTFNGEPFAQASQAQKIRASVAIAAAMNPKLRVAIVKDGSLLDRKSWTALEEYASANDLQIWIETVDAKGPSAILIEDGGAAGAGTAVVEQIEDVI